ncbi:MAG TPA: hypothetical protein VIL99_16690, partial [Ignavibacteria bacterium]
MKLQKYISKLLDVLIAFVLLVFFSSYGFNDSRNQGWYVQTFPNLNGSTITSMTFLDSLTGFAVTNSNSLLQEYILKTTNGGDNWIINYTFNTPNSNWSFVKIGFINSNTGFAFSWAEMFKTTNGGSNWNMVINNLYPNDIAIINKDTILAVKNSGLDGGVYQTTDGGYSFTRIWGNSGTGMPYSIYMYDKYLGFQLYSGPTSYDMRRTSDGGFTWTNITGEQYVCIQMLDSLTGWKGFNDIKKTTDGGLTWNNQQPPNFYENQYFSISILNKDTVWASGPMIIKNNIYYGVLMKTTNGGANWGYQLLDTLVGYDVFHYINFINRKYGWAYPFFTGGVIFDKEIHTVVGGNDITFFTGIKLVENFIPSGYTLGQNYPNPFNPSTNIPFELNESGYIILKVYDITGRTIKE